MNGSPGTQMRATIDPETSLRWTGQGVLGVAAGGARRRQTLSALDGLRGPIAPVGRLAALFELSLFVAGYYYCFWRAAETMPAGRVFLLSAALVLLPFLLNSLHRLRRDEVGYDF